MMLASIREAFAADEAFGDAPINDRLKKLAEHIAVAEPAVPVLREARVIGYRILEAESAKPAIGQVEMHFLTQPTLRPNTEAVPD